MRGSVMQRGKDPKTWTLIFPLPKGPDGRRRQQWVAFHGNKREAETKLTELLHQLDGGTFIRPTKLTVGEYLGRWLRDYVESHVRETTARRYRSIVQRHLIPALGAIPLMSLSPSHVQAAYAHALGEKGRLDGRGGGLSARSVVQHHRILSEALKHAMRWGLIGRNVATLVDPPRVERTEADFLDAEAIHALLRAAQGTPYHTLLLVAAATGLRRSEILALRWRDINIEAANLRVVRALHQLPGPRFVFLEPKSGKSRRAVALGPAAILAIRAHREQQEAERERLGMEAGDDSLVFPNPKGLPISPATLSKAFKRIATKAGLPDAHLHLLRHSHASLLLEQGVHLKVVQERLGHSTIAITADTYSHVAAHLQQEAAAKFDEALLREPSWEAKSPRTHDASPTS